MNGSMSFRSIVRMFIMLAFVVTISGSTVVNSHTELLPQTQSRTDVLFEELSFLIKGKSSTSK